MDTTITADFSADWKAYLQQNLASQGYQADPLESIDSISHKFFNVQRRKIHQTPRQVHESREFQCPATQVKGYQALKAKFIAGGDVTPHLSKRLLESDYDDYLLNDWGIHHFHLGENIENSGFIERAGPLLFAYVTPTDVFCINVFPHGVWAEQELIRILHRNWPDAISNFRLNGALSLERSLSNDDIAKLRKAGIQALIQIEGVVYGPMGGGYSSNGTSTRAVLETIKYKKLVRALETHVKEHLPALVDEIRKHGFAPANPPAFSLLVNEDGFYAVETHSKVAFLLHPHERD